MTLHIVPLGLNKTYSSSEHGKDVAIEIFSLSNIYMSGFRVGFAVGNKDMIQALKSIKHILMLACLEHYKMPPHML